MDTETARETLGDGGLAGLGLALLGGAVLARENGRIAAGTLAIVLGVSLVGRGLVGSFLESMGMGYEDVY
jgi:hypothetical protein